MGKPKVSLKDLRKTPKQVRENFYHKEQTDHGKNGNQGTTNDKNRIQGFWNPYRGWLW